MHKRHLYTAALAVLFPALAVLASFFLSPHSLADHSSVAPLSETLFRAKVLDVRGAGKEEVPGADRTSVYQDLTVQIVSGEREGESVFVRNDGAVMFAEGDRLYIHLLEPHEQGGESLWYVGEPDRKAVLLWMAAAFILVTVLTAGMAGVRALVALAGSFVIILFGLVPALSAGFPPAITCTVLAVFVLAFAMIVTHGANRLTFTALAGSMAALIVAATVAEIAVSLARLSGFVSDETVFLNLASGGALNLTGLLLGGILIGIVGALNDVSVSQVHTVAEIRYANPSLSKIDLFRRAMRVGREHMGAVVDTLPLAYTGTALPLLLLFAGSSAPFLFIVNREIFSAEILRILAGGIGLMLSGVVATLLAVLVVSKKTAAHPSTHTHHH